MTSLLLLLACTGRSDGSDAPAREETGGDSAMPTDSSPDSRETGETGDTGPETGDTDTGDPPVPVDGDGDGYYALATGGDDCDDQDPRTHPGGAEVCDYADRDCDGDPYAPGVCASPPVPEDAAWATWLGIPENAGVFGHKVAIVGDFDEDGLPEPFVQCRGCDNLSDPGAFHGGAFLLRNRGAPLLPVPFPDEVRAGWVGDETFMEQGDIAAVGDVDGDGYADLAFTGSEWGSIGWLGVQYGPWDASWSRHGAIDAATDAWWWSGSAGERRWGHSLLGPGDLDGDGRAEILVGRYGTGGDDTNAAVYRVPGGDWRGASEADAEAWLAVESASSDGTSALHDLRPAGDFDGDGAPDALAVLRDEQATYRASVAVLDGANLAPGDATFEDAALATWGLPSTSSARCYTTLGDWDDDGYDDVAVSDAYVTEAAWPATETAGVWVVAGRLGASEPVWIDEAAVGLWHDTGGNWLNSPLDCAGAGDFDGDLREDFLLGGARVEGSGADASALNTSSDMFVFLLPGRDGLPGGTVELMSVALPIATRHQDTDATPAVRSALGRSIAFGDLTGDGLDDALVGDDYANALVGDVHVFPGWEIPWDEVRGGR